VPGFDETGADREVLGESGWIVQRVETIGKIAMSRPNRGLFLGDCGRFQIEFQGGPHHLDGSAFEALLLDMQPLARSLGPADLRRCAQILADVKEVGQDVSLIPKNFPALQTDPFGSVGDDMDATGQSPASVLGAMSPPLADFGDRSKGRAVTHLRAALCVRGHQSHLFPLSRA